LCPSRYSCAVEDPIICTPAEHDFLLFHDPVLAGNKASASSGPLIAIIHGSERGCHMRDHTALKAADATYEIGFTLHIQD
jgi:hypothetical protein